jgi:ubiquinone/menaquinone biosynthesis C-methylase UbiE
MARSQSQSQSQSHIDSVRSIYDERSEQYDESEVHVKQAQDYCRWAGLRSGESVLDLACGTGLVALGAKRQVTATGHVVGVDISDGMLTVARRKAQTAGLDVRFFNHDISDLSAIRDEIMPREGAADGFDGFDVITCASALVLLPDPLTALKNWKALLRPGGRGRLVTDVQTKDANVVMNIFSDIASRVHVSVPWNSELLQSQETLAKLARDAGLDVQSIFETEAYATTRYHRDDARQVFEQAIGKSMYSNFGRADIRDEARQLFVQRFADMAGTAGSIEEETRYWVIVATNSE